MKRIPSAPIILGTLGMTTIQNERNTNYLYFDRYL